MHTEIYSCEDHIDMAIDDFLVNCETFPILDNAKEGKCHYCSSTAVYVLSGSNDK